MNYCIARVKKLKTFGSIVGSCKHTFRDSPTPNADPRLTPMNKSLGAKSTLQVIAGFRSKLLAKRRKDAVLGLEYLITASPGFFSHRNSDADYFQDAIQWIRTRHGSENVISATLHMDETTPHLVVYVVPITSDGRLSAKEFCGGPKKLSEFQTKFHQDVAAKFGLRRGVVGSKASHRSVAKFYAEVVNPIPTEKPRLTRMDYLGGALGLPTDSLTKNLQLQNRVLKKQTYLDERVAQSDSYDKAQTEKINSMGEEIARVKNENKQALAAAEASSAKEAMLVADLASVREELGQLRDYCSKLLDYIKRFTGLSRKPSAIHHEESSKIGMRNAI